MVKEFQSVISREAKKQFYEVENRLPDAVMACVGGGSNSIGMFADFIEEKGVKLIGVEAAGKGIETGNMPLQWHSESRESYTVCVPISYRMKTEM